MFVRFSDFRCFKATCRSLNLMNLNHEHQQPRSKIIDPLEGDDLKLFISTREMSLNDTIDFCDASEFTPSSKFWKLKIEQIFGNVAVLQRSDLIEHEEWDTYVRISYVNYEYAHFRSDNTAILRTAAKPREVSTEEDNKIMLYDETDGVTYFHVRAVPLQVGQNFLYLSYVDNFDSCIQESTFFIDHAVAKLWINERLFSLDEPVHEMKCTVYSSRTKFSEKIIKTHSGAKVCVSEIFAQINSNLVFTAVFEAKYIIDEAECQVMLELMVSKVRAHERKRP